MAQQTFRSAFNGFNREDVVNYIEYLNAQHAAEVSQLRSELEFLRNSAQQQPVAEECADSGLIEQQANRIRELFDKCKEQEQTIAELSARPESPAQPAAFKSCTEEELEAYRRAERAERLALERAEQVYHRTNAILSDATAKVDEAAAAMSRMTDHVSGQLTQLQDAVSGSKQALYDAAAAMYAIRPDGENQ